MGCLLHTTSNVFCLQSTTVILAFASCKMEGDSRDVMVEM